MAEGLGDPEIVGLVADRLQELRKRLIDSSRRNPLVNIHFRANSTNVFRVVDELPDILRFNLTKGTAMRLVALPALDEELPDEQTDIFLDALHLARREDENYLAELDSLDPSAKNFDEKALVIERALKDRLRAKLGLVERQTKDNPSLAEHARAHGISPDYSLPRPEDEHEDGRHQDTDIQTLMLPDKLSRIAKGLFERARSFERETGVNVLHVAFGLLEWKAPEEKDRYVSPLALLEIRIERRQSPQGAEFHLTGEGDALVNTTLKQKFFSEYRLSLPDYASGSIEEYFREVADTSPSGWHWRVRREVAIGIFPSSRIAMYHDLDPEARPVAENPIVARILASTGSGESAYAPVYETDDPETARKVPHLVMDADASQFSALVDVANGEHVSIEGPPGSGKSQTIVNLVAAALAERKRILFVAEKLTALDVVKNRLEAVGLGEFILPLQAGRNTRDQVYDSLEERLSIEVHDGPTQDNFDSHQSALEKRRQALQDYLDVLGSDFGASGLSIYDVLGHGIATHVALDEVPREIRRIALPDCEALDAARIDALVDDAEAFAQRLGRSHRMPVLWREVTATILNRDDAEDACDSIARLADRMEDFARRVRDSEAAPLFGEDPFSTDIAVLGKILSTMIEKAGVIDPMLVEQFTDPACHRLVHDFCEQVQERRTLVGRLGRRIRDPEGWDLAGRLRAARDFATANGGRVNPEDHQAQIVKLEADIEALRLRITLTKALSARWAEREGVTLAQIRRDAGRILSLPEVALDLRRALPDRRLEHTGRVLREAHRERADELGRIRQALPRAGDHDPAAIRHAANCIADAGVMRLLSSDYKAARKTYVNILGGSAKDTRETMVRRLGSYADWLDRRMSFERTIEFKDAFGPIFTGLSTDLDHVDAVVELHRRCIEIAGSDDILRRELEGGNLAPLRAFVAQEMPDATLADQRDDLDKVLRALDEECRRQEEALTHLEMTPGLAILEGEELEDLLSGVVRLDEITSLIEGSTAAGIIGERFRGTATRTDALVFECDVAQILAGAPDPAPAISILRSGRAVTIAGEVERLAEERQSIENETAEIVRRVGLGRATAAGLAGRIEDLRAAAADPYGLMERARLRKSEERLRVAGFDRLVDWALVEGETLDPARIGPITRAIIARSMADRACQIHGDVLQGYDGEDFDRIRAEIARKDSELIKMSRAVVRNALIANAHPPEGNGLGKKSDYTEMSLLRNEMSKKRNRLGVRELTRRAGEALLALKPCWMMSPLAVAQYLHMGLAFDLVVIDEASQMTPENAIGALSRARQAVVVGDTRQLPPTTFFQKMMDDTDIDEDLREDSESVLDMANVAFRPVRQLRWHYRSRHSALIRFSNTWMYDDKLTIFPSAREDDPEFGVHLVEVNGIYRARTNEIEARRVVQAAIAHMRDHPDLSLGICTMNSDQKELIREEFEREEERNPRVYRYVRDWQERNGALEEFFIKNLETIQGDERDVMFISTLYGPESPGARVHQRFGPINAVHGHRRLNVLFTRAKCKIVTFTSLKPTDILADEGKARGVRMFRAWLEYCASGHVPDRIGSAGERESPFEDFVAKEIEVMGYEVVPQVGAAGYRIDMGVRHPDWPYGFILGVECDGASYHSSKSSRDRDRLRQEVLEGLGWRFYRIWSTDWFNDPRTQIERLRKTLDAALVAAKAGQIKERSDPESGGADGTERRLEDPFRQSDRLIDEKSEPVVSMAEIHASPRFSYRGKGFDAQMEVSPSGDFVVTAGSRARVQTQTSIPEHMIALRNALTENGILREEEGFLVFRSPYSFTSISAAAAAVCGTAASGPKVWKLPDGCTYADWNTRRSSTTTEQKPVERNTPINISPVDTSTAVDPQTAQKQKDAAPQDSPIGLGSHVKVEILKKPPEKLAFTLVDGGNDLDNGKLGIHTPLGQALIDAQEGDEVECQVGVRILEARVLEVS